MKKKPQLSFFQIWNMSFGFLGIQFGFALQNANVSRIFETLGADVSQIPILWIAAPVTGLIVQPIIGYLSDNTWNSFGRRRPFFPGWSDSGIGCALYHAQLPLPVDGGRDALDSGCINQRYHGTLPCLCG